MSNEELLSTLDELENYSENNSNNARKKKIRDKFLVPKINETKRSLHERENTKNLSKNICKKLTKILLN